MEFTRVFVKIAEGIYLFFVEKIKCPALRRGQMLKLAEHFPELFEVRKILTALGCIDAITNPIHEFFPFGASCFFGRGQIVDGNDFIDRELNEKHKTEGVTRQLRAFEITGKGIARHGYEICDAEGNVIGEVTSGTMGPSVKKAIGMGYVAKAHCKLGNEIYIKIREKLIPATIVKLPFYKGE